MKKLLAGLICLALCVGLLGCGGGNSASAPAGQETDSNGKTKYKVVYSIPGLSAPIWTVASEGFLNKAKEYGWDAEILDPNDNLETQISQIENALVKGVDAIVITPIDGEAVSTLMEQCKEAGVPVVAIDRQVKGPSLTTVEADNYNIGKALGEMFIKDLGNEQGKVLIVGGPLSSSATVNRTEGFKAAIKGKANIEIVAESATEMDGEIVLAAVTNYLQANPDINAVMSCTDYILPSVITALDEAGKLHKVGEEGHVRIYSVDGDGYGLTQAKNGIIDATYGLDPYGWAAAAVEALKTHFEGGTVEPNILIAGEIVTADNLEELKAAGKLWGASSMEK